MTLPVWSISAKVPVARKIVVQVGSQAHAPELVANFPANGVTENLHQVAEGAPSDAVRDLYERPLDLGDHQPRCGRLADPVRRTPYRAGRTTNQTTSGTYPPENQQPHQKPNLVRPTQPTVFARVPPNSTGALWLQMTNLTAAVHFPCPCDGYGKTRPQSAPGSGTNFHVAVNTAAQSDGYGKIRPPGDAQRAQQGHLMPRRETSHHRCILLKPRDSPSCA